MRRLNLCLIAAAIALSSAQAAVIELFEDDPAFIDLLPRQDAPTQIAYEEQNVFSGVGAVRVWGDPPNTQRYNPVIPGWQYKIVENPAGDQEARWILFAWNKLEGAEGIMIQFPDNGNWGLVAGAFVDPPAPGTRRYISGLNITGWTGIQVNESPVLGEWEYYIRDLWEDFGAFTMTGIALTPFNGVGLYDAIYLAHTKRELEEIVSSILPVQPLGKLEVFWGAIKAKVSR
ncbi:MAG: hypothetical protein KatS3mg115_2438 [Candidatus Poribacteria bacterium]|nr:MAG: hypothetical protein KatS3mg115_2438 [Candidatus Poribacteria bacterium]